MVSTKTLLLKHYYRRYRRQGFCTPPYHGPKILDLSCALLLVVCGLMVHPHGALYENSNMRQLPLSDQFSRVLFSFLPPLLATPLPLIFSALFRPVLPSKSALFCRAKGTPQSLERGGFRMDLSTRFGKEILSRNLRKKRSAIDRIFTCR